MSSRTLCSQMVSTQYTKRKMTTHRKYMAPVNIGRFLVSLITKNRVYTYRSVGRMLIVSSRCVSQLLAAIQVLCV